MGKEKLTLSVDKEVVEKAKKLGINISEITENILKGYTSAEKPNGSIYDAYRQLFSAIIPLLKEFGGQVKVGKGGELLQMQDEKGIQHNDEITYDILLDASGSFYMDFFDNWITDIEKIDQRDFLPPEKILSNLVDVLAKSREASEEKMRQIMMAKRIVDAMSETLIKRPSAKSDEKG
jgi:hypothetical protein